MINLKLLKENPEKVKAKILSKDPSFDTGKLLNLYEAFNLISKEIANLNEKINTLSNLKNQSESLDAIKEQVKEIKHILQEKTKQLAEKEEEYLQTAYACPNIPMDELPSGNKESNFVTKTVGKKPSFSFIPRHHADLLTTHSEKDFNFGSKVAKSGFYAYKDKLAWLIYKLAHICLKHNELNGFSVIHIPQVANTQTVTYAGNLPRFKDELFFLEKEDLVLIPTAEVILASYLKDTVVEEKDLPIRLTAWTRCYRKEAGGYGAHERGLIRIHEFEKVEIFSFTSEENASQEHEKMIETVESLLQLFELHYQVVLLAKQDCSFSSAKTYDIELWLPGQGQFKEVSSISNCTDFQSRRSKSKYKTNKKSNLLYTLNGSSLALPRLMVALLETWQKEDGEIDFEGLFSLLRKIENKLHV